SADWWVPLVSSLAGASVGGVSAFVVSGRTLKGQADQAAVQRLEAALAELILGVQALYDPRSCNSKEAPPVPDDPRVRRCCWTGSEELDDSADWWVPLVSSLAGASVGGVSAFVVSGRTLKGQ
ncbi:hypothetical protein D9C01_12955, partial [Corynebacterium diphtheriae]